MKLIKTSIYSAISSIIKISTGFITGKIIAIYTGQAGLAILGQFTNFIYIITSLSNGAINSGVIKYTSEFRDDKHKLSDVFSTSLKISFFSSILIGFNLILFSVYFSKNLFDSDIYVGPMRVLGALLLLYSLNSLILSILNGLQIIKIFTVINITSSIFGLLLTILLVTSYKLEGALYAVVASQIITFFFSFVMLVKQGWFSYKDFAKPISREITVNLANFSLMTIVSTLIVPISLILIRKIIIQHVGINEAGNWQGLLRISEGYLLIITTSLGTYYLPKLSSLKTSHEIRMEIVNGYKLILPIVLIMGLSVFFLREIIIDILYTGNFNSMSSLFLYHLIGDFVKIASWLLSYLMLAKSMTKQFIISEILYSSTYVLLAYYFVDLSGVIGITIAYLISNIVYFIMMLYIFRKLVFNRDNG